MDMFQIRFVALENKVDNHHRPTLPPTRSEVQKSRKSGKNIPEMHDLAAFERVKLSVMDGLVGGRVRFEYPK